MSKLNLTILTLVAGVGSASAGFINVQPVPEAGTTGLFLGIALVALIALRRKFAPKI
jgi:hypothetical protein